jgi:hypothetical protein
MEMSHRLKNQSTSHSPLAGSINPIDHIADSLQDEGVRMKGSGARVEDDQTLTFQWQRMRDSKGFPLYSTWML